MKRDLTTLADTKYDLLIIGGGIYGAALAWEASSRGLRVGLVEKGDFGHATSANSQKTIHGGLRYLQQGNIKRMRRSMRERDTLMRIAPHLVHPLAFIMPTYGHSFRGREVLSAALFLNDLIGYDRNRLNDPQKHLPRGRVIPKDECRFLIPGLRRHDLTGGATWHDSQVYNSERLTLSYLRSAADAGANIANYVEVTGFIKNQDSVQGVVANDRLTNQSFEIRGKVLVNATGPWIDRVLGMLKDRRLISGIPFAKAFNIVTPALFEEFGVGLSSQNEKWDLDGVGYSKKRLLFVTPWRRESIIGTGYIAFQGDPDGIRVSSEDAYSFLEQVNLAYPEARLKREDILFVHRGLVPLSGEDARSGELRRAGLYQILDHRHDGLKGLLSVVGVKLTTARYVAEKTIDQVFLMLGYKPPPSISADTPLHGGEIELFEAFLQNEIRKSPSGLSEEIIRHLIYNYGSVYPEVLRYLDGGLGIDQTLPVSLAVLRAETVYAVRHEMAQTLADVILRRTEVGTAGHPGAEVLNHCVEWMGYELGWSQDRIKLEKQLTNERFDHESKE